LLCLSCQEANNEPRATTHVYVRLNGVTQDIKTTRVTWSVNDTADSRSPYPFKNTVYFGFDLFAPGNRGKLAIVVDGLDSECIVASGETQLQIDGQEYVETTIALTTQSKTCPLTVEVVGQGSGSVRSEPPGILCKSKCSAKFPLGTKVRLFAEPDVMGTPYNWSGVCSGGGDCEITANSDAKALIDFTPRVCSTSGWCLENPYPVADKLTAGWVSPSGQTYIVGANGVILRSVGNVWTSQNSRTYETLNGIWGASDNDIWIVGGNGTLLHWEGFWKPIPSPTMFNLTSVWGSSADQVWAVGDATTVLKWNGVSWTPITVPGVPTSRLLWKVWGSGPNDVWVVGDSGLILNWNGFQWTVSNSNTTRLLFDVWGTAPDNVWAMGYTSVRRYNGSTWLTVTLDDPMLRGLDKIWGSGVNTAWAGGTGSDLKAGIWRWDGSKFLRAYSDSIAFKINALFGEQTGKAFAVGDSGLLIRYDGTDWRRVSSGDLADGKLYGVWGKDPNTVWAVGGNFFGDAGYIYRNDGGVWTKDAFQTNKRLFAAWGSGSDDVWAVGAGGMIVRWNGMTWNSVPSGTTSDLLDIYEVGPNNVWAVGAGGTVIRWNGANWSSGGSLTDNLTSVYGVGAEVWVAGLDRIHYWSGTAWGSSPAPGVKRVQGLDAAKLYAVGDFVFYSWNGSQWVSTAIPSKLSTLYALSPSDIWAAGPTLWHFDGTKWLQADPAVRPLERITAAGKDLFGVGDGGTILRFRR
jgi:hypothetical protein